MLDVNPNERSSREPSSTRFVVALLLLLPFACTVFDFREDVPPQEWRQSRGPVVPHDDFPADCTLCHLPGGWQEIRADFQFDHAAETGVPLLGAHAAAECLRCHNDRGPVTEFAQRGCAGCHEDWHRRQLGANCQDCHDEVNWLPKSQIVEHGFTRFPLIGAHAGIACFACHEGAQVGNFKRESVACESCHTDDLARTATPDHVIAGWTNDCQRCHVPIAWTGSAFVHTTFPLTGVHATTNCTDCHVGGVYQGTPRTCEACHLADAQGVASPNHTAAGWTANCQQCHTTLGWSGANFIHSTFPLTGAHTSLACAACHGGGAYQGTPRTCVGCHLPDYNATTNPNHQNAGFPTSCESCHVTNQWNGAVFNHSFPIRGPHNQSCATCHTTPGNFTLFNCLVCHDHNQTKMDDKHKNEPGYSYTSQACLNCHPNGK